MLENINEQAAQSQAEENIADSTQTTESMVFIPIKFNKQVLELELEKAQELAQKGMKFDLISKDYDALKKLALAENKSVSDYVSALLSQKHTQHQNDILEKCGGDREFAEHILKLENTDTQEVRGFGELKENFPQIKDMSDLPESVVEAAKIKGTLLLDEYLRYLHCQDMAVKSSIKNQRDASNSAMGPLTNRNRGQSPETREFLKGLWQK